MITTKQKLTAGSLLVAVAFLFLPVVTNAASYGFVANDGHVRSIEANSWQEAINNASQISFHSGVILLNTAQRQAMVGTRVW